MAGKESMIVEAIREAEEGTSGEIHVHLTRRWVERDPLARARKLFHRYGLERTRNRNAVLLYVNVRRHRFAIYGDSGVHAKVGEVYWKRTLEALKRDLQSTYLDRAIRFAVLRIGETLRHSFPQAPGEANPNELPDTVTRD